MRTPEECRRKAEGLEIEAEASATDTRRRAYMDLADHWRKLADRYERTGLDRRRAGDRRH